METETSPQSKKLNEEPAERIRELERRVAELEAQLKQKQVDECRVSAENTFVTPSDLILPALPPVTELSANQIERYSRQMILTSGLITVAGQKRLLASSILVVGAGGIGSTALLYLAAAGIGRIGVVDFDSVEVSNLHRQVIHGTHRVGWNKAVSACQRMYELNPTVEYRAYPEALSHDNALSMAKQFDCVVDCSDNPLTRYLLNDVCVLSGRPLVSASAVGTEGQLTVYNYNPASNQSNSSNMQANISKSPCYRCLYPRPSATVGCRACADAGVLGPVPGLMGLLQSMEVLKVLTHGTMPRDIEPMHQRMLLYDSLAGNASSPFFSVKKPAKQPKCPVCGPQAQITTVEESRESLLTAVGPAQKEEGADPTLSSSIPPQFHKSCLEFYDNIHKPKQPHILLDVRIKSQFELCSLPGSIHIPLELLPERLDDIQELSEGTKPIYCICRRGNASVEAVRLLHEAKTSTHPAIHQVFNLEGGLNSWRRDVDQEFPVY